MQPVLDEQYAFDIRDISKICCSCWHEFDLPTQYLLRWRNM